MMRRMCFLLMMGLALTADVWAQVPMGDYDLLDMRFGLPENRVRAITQMPDGRRAIATKTVSFLSANGATAEV